VEQFVERFGWPRWMCWTVEPCTRSAEWLTNRFDLAAHARVARARVAHAEDDARSRIEDVIDGLYTACTNGHLDVAKWLVPTFRITIADMLRLEHDEDIFASVCRLGNLEIAQWFAATFHLSVKVIRHALCEACVSGCFDVAEWLTAHFGLTALLETGRHHSGSVPEALLARSNGRSSGFN